MCMSLASGLRFFIISSREYSRVMDFVVLNGVAVYLLLLAPPHCELPIPSLKHSVPRSQFS